MSTEQTKIKLISVQGGTENGGYEYNEVVTPSTITYSVRSLKTAVFDLGKIHSCFIRAEEIRDKKFPLEANPRKPAPTGVTKKMTATLSDFPEMFSFLNNGVTVIASKVQVQEEIEQIPGEVEEPAVLIEDGAESDSEETLIEVSYGANTGQYGDGICNGGHTYYTIEQYQGDLDKAATVRVEFIEFSGAGDAEGGRGHLDNIIKVARARNAHNSLQSRTEVAFSGGYDKIIDALGKLDKHFSWREGDTNAVKGAAKSEAFIAYLCACSPFWYEHFLTGAKGDHMQAARNAGTVHKHWVKAWNDEDSRFEKGLDHMLPLVLDIFNLIEYLRASLLDDDFSVAGAKWRKGNIWQTFGRYKESPLKVDHVGYLKGYNLPPTWVAMLIGQFRSNVWLGIGEEGQSLIGWTKDPYKLWDVAKGDFMKNLVSYASSLRGVPSFGLAFIAMPGLYQQMTQLLQMMNGTNHTILKDLALNPDIIMDSVNGVKYVSKGKDSDSDDESVTILIEDINEDGAIPLIQVTKHDSPPEGKEDHCFEYFIYRENE